jgi:hypothetical protein
MSVEFDEPSIMTSTPYRVQQKQSGLVRAVLSLGLAKDEQGAQVVLAVICGVGLLLAVGVYFLYGRPYYHPTPTVQLREDLARMKATNFQNEQRAH